DEATRGEDTGPGPGPSLQGDRADPGAVRGVGPGRAGRNLEEEAGAGRPARRRLLPAVKSGGAGHQTLHPTRRALWSQVFIAARARPAAELGRLASKRGPGAASPGPSSGPRRTSHGRRTRNDTRPRMSSRRAANRMSRPSGEPHATATDDD